MHIPDKYRDRYDRLAASHPWMREMREMREMRDETNGIADGTNGIADEITLPEGDAVAILRKYANFWSLSHETYTQCDPDWEKTTMRALADMVERDYVKRGESGIDAESKRAIGFWRNRCERIAAERDEWKAKAEGSSKVRVGQSNLEWMYRNDKSFREYCQWVLKEHPLTFGMTFDTNEDAGEWLMAPHDCGHSADMSQKSADCVRDGGEMSEVDSREKLEADALSFANGFIRNHNGAISWNDELYRGIIDLIDRQAAISERELCRQCEWPSLAAQPDREAYDRIAELTRKLEDAEFERDELESMIERDYVKRSTFDLACKKRDEAVRDAKLAVHARDSVMDERDALQEKLDDDRKYVRLKKQVDSLTVRAVGAEQEADELKAIVDRLKAENEHLRAECYESGGLNATARIDKLTAERDNLAADLKSCEGQLKTERNNFRQATGARDYWRDKLSMVLDRLRELGCEVGSINDVPITVELPDGDEGMA